MFRQVIGDKFKYFCMKQGHSLFVLWALSRTGYTHTQWIKFKVCFVGRVLAERVPCIIHNVVSMLRGSCTYLFPLNERL